MRLTNSIVKAGAGAVVALSLVTLVAGFAWLSGSGNARTC